MSNDDYMELLAATFKWKEPCLYEDSSVKLGQQHDEIKQWHKTPDSSSLTPRAVTVT